MNSRGLDITTQNLDHLGLISSVAKDLGIVEKIDIRLPISGKHGSIVTMGERVLGMILNGLGFLNDRIYMISDFFQNKPISRLIASHIKAEHLNDDALGRCLDAIHEYGTTKLFSEIAFEIGIEQKVIEKNAHLDTTSLCVFGEYNNEQEDNIPNITYGFSKDHRQDLKQIMLSLTTTGKAGFPIWMEALDGNSSDKINFHETLKKMTAFQQQLKEAPSFIFVADSSLYTPDKLLSAPNLRFITRVPESIKEAKLLCQIPKEKLDWVELKDGYSAVNLCSIYGNIKQRWQLIFSEQAFKREQRTLVKKIENEHQKLNKDLWRAGVKIYTCELDAKKAASLLSKKIKYHSLTYDIKAVTRYEHAGRSKKGESPKVIGYQICAKSERDTIKIAKKESTLGRFILATNELDYECLPDENILMEYKQQSQVERGFRFIKDPCFQVSSIFLKSPHRIEALMMVMTLCLMVYNMAQFYIRRALEDNNDTVPNQLKKPTKKPTARWIFRMMQGISVVQMKLKNIVIKEYVTNLSNNTAKVVRYFGKHAMQIYGVPAEVISSSGYAFSGTQ
jgi:transposase